MTDGLAQRVLSAAVETAVKRGYKPYPLAPDQRYDLVSIKHGAVVVYVGKRYSHSKNTSYGHLVPVRDVLYDHGFAKAIFRSEWQEALQRMVLMETLDEKISYVKRFVWPN